MSDFGLIGAAVGGYFGGVPGATLGGQLGGGIDANNARADAAASANAFSASQYQNRYQTQVKDLEAAGLNPMLAYMQSPGSAPTGQSYQPTNVFEGASQSYAAAQNVQRTGENIDADTLTKRAQRFLTEAQTGAAESSSAQSRANTSYLETQAKKISLELKNIPKEGDRLDALISNLQAELPLIQERTSTQAQATQQMKWLAVKTMLDSDLVGLDIKAITALDNLGKISAQFKPILDIIRMFSRH